MLKKSVSLFLISSFLVTPAKAGVQAWTPASAGMTNRFDGAPKKKPNAWKPLFVYGPIGTVTGLTTGLLLSSVVASNLSKPCAQQVYFAGAISGLIGGSLGGSLQAVPMVSHEDQRAAAIPVLAGAAVPAGIALISYFKGVRAVNPFFAALFGGISAWAAATLVAHLDNR